jgi:acyl-CoA synthetase (AMP-forming)/AMP-acid ligase II
METFDPGRFLTLVEEQRITRTSLAPTMAAFVLDQPGLATADLTSVRGCSYGGMPMPVDTARRLADRFPALYTGYGQSESTLLVTGLTPADHRRALSGEPGLLESCGRAYEGVGLELRADDDTVADPGEVGELCIRSDYSMTGYWNRPDESAAALAGGWLHTGDLARRDDEGFVYLVDRKKDLVISGGLNVYPAEVERVLQQLPGIAEVAVVGRPDPVWGERVVAVVVARPDSPLSTDEVIAHCRTQLAAYKAPKDVVFTSALPKTVTGKYRKAAIRESLERD